MTRQELLAKTSEDVRNALQLMTCAEMKKHLHGFNMPVSGTHAEKIDRLCVVVGLIQQKPQYDAIYRR